MYAHESKYRHTKIHILEHDTHFHQGEEHDEMYTMKC